ncbi:MAG: helicase-related protein [Victivallaceae bacterium]|nr:helicase-related protein [Victivallaceae bacterium]
MQILDNINTLWGDDLKKSLKVESKLKVAASCFSIYAYEALKNELEKVDSLEFIFTAPAFVPIEATDRVSRERRKFHIPKKQCESNLYGSEFEIQLKNKLTQRAIAKECAEWIRKKVTFKSNVTQAPMQQFAYIDVRDAASAYMPLHGFTAVDLGYQQGDAVSNFITKFADAPSTQTWLNLFNQIWNDNSKLKNVTDAICTHIESVYQENSPEKIYFLMLYNIFNEFLEDLNEDVLPNELTGYNSSTIWTKLFNFQKDAATGIINKLEKYNGCILADSVGLGKTFTALAVIKYYELRNRSVLVLCPKKLADNWQTYRSNYKTNILADDRLNYDLLFHTDLSRVRGESMGVDLAKVNWGNYDLIVIDESHNFRNRGRNIKDKETRYERLMNAVIKAGVKTKVLMLSATPVNNRFSDLRNQIALAYEGESDRLQEKLDSKKSIEDIFRQAQTAFNFWSKLPPAQRTSQAILDALDFDFFELLDSVTIARSRKHIENFYDTKDIGKFPERRKPLSFRPPLTTRKGVMNINEIYQHLKEVKQAVYAPMTYVHPSRIQKYEEMYGTETKSGRLLQRDREKALQALMTTNLLKRLESSVEAFRITLKHMEDRISTALADIEKYKNSQEAYQAVEFNDSDVEFVEDDDDFELSEDYTEGKVKIDFADMDLVSWKRDLDEDQTLIYLLLEEMQKISPADDAKLQHLKKHILEKIQNPINPDNKKILLFTAFADTANYLYSNIVRELTKQKVDCAKVTGSDTAKTTLGSGYSFQDILTFFSPRSKDKALLYPDTPGEIDVLVGTDCISEGQNLQDCDYLINYDIHWNPVRIIQRFGRIDRIGSVNDSIQLVNYWPDISLNEYINLKERVESRMVIADAVATADDNPLSAETNDVSYRKEQLRRLQDEVIEMEDLKTGVNITDLGLNDFRMDLVNYIKNNGELGHLPSGLHAVIPANERSGLIPGVIFTLRNRNAGVNINQINRLHPYYLVYISNDGEIIYDHTRVKYLLDLVRSNCKGTAEPVIDICKLFNHETNDGREMSRYSDLLGQAIRSMIDMKEEKEIDSLFEDTHFSVKTDGFDGLDDFELISFIVIHRGE